MSGEGEDRGIAWRIETLEVVPSTQDIVRARAEAGEPEGFVLQARGQSVGRGRQGTRWESPPGNLYLSALLRPGCPAGQGGQIALVCAVALARALEPFIAPGARIGLKWPNDLLIGERKAAGILVESDITEGSRIGFAVVGIGVNVTAPPEGAAGIGPRAQVDTVRDAVLDAVAYFYEIWKGQGFSPIRTAWLERAENLSGTIRVGKPPYAQTGRFLGLSPEGRLIFQPAGGMVQEIAAGPVFYAGEQAGEESAKSL